MFFRKKKRIEIAETATDTVSADATAAVEGTLPEAVEAGETVLAAADEAPEAETRDVAKADETIRLFPGFERDDFEVGFKPDAKTPALMMRWKDEGGEWFVVPAIFNRGVLAAMDERDSAGDLNRLLRNYGYDVEPAKA